ncbi:MAG: class I SAM-dependent methyltransferase [Magnetococcales bacterium]|nr:class I SAM-dependent methyltransferase [Magnetococcales bacterium]
MRKDYLPVEEAAASETAFIEDYWTAVWQREGGVKQSASDVSKKAEFRILEPYLAQLPPGARLLDGGCGLGDWTLTLAERGFRVTGLDLSQQTIAKLREYFPQHDFQAGDIRQTGFEASSFDLYFSWGVFEHFEDGMQGCLAEAMRLLKPGGRLLISVPFDNLRHALRNALTPLPTVPQRQGLRFYQYRFTREELARQLTLAGFAVEAVHPIHQRQGVLRALHHTLGLPYAWIVTRGLSLLLAPLLPQTVFAHMILAVARKPEAAPSSPPA